MKNLIKISLLSAAFFLFGCGPNRHFAVNEQRAAPAPEKTPETAEQKLGTVQQQGFEFVYVFRRKDGAPLDAEDRKFLRENAPPQTNQWIVTDDGATAIAGSNYRFPPENLDALRKRFNVEDKSKSEEAANADK
jgi:hypothetical protein